MQIEHVDIAKTNLLSDHVSNRLPIFLYLIALTDKNTHRTQTHTYVLNDNNNITSNISNKRMYDEEK